MVPNMNIIGVKIQDIGRIQYFDAGLLNLTLGDEVIVETGRGIEMGMVTSGPQEPLSLEELEKLTRIIRMATEKDRERLLKNQEEAQRAYHVAKEKMQEHDLPMSLVSAEYIFDRSKYIFYFTAENRVDFRDLVRDLASTLHCRVELWQIGARDETKFYGGLGICGRTLCCNSFLKDFAPVTIKMAKDQSLALNPLKISGICGRLMCCLRFEHETYREARARLPREGASVMTPQGKGRVIELNALKETVTVELENEARLECLADQVWLPGERPDQERLLEEAARAAEKPERIRGGRSVEKRAARGNGEKGIMKDEDLRLSGRERREKDAREGENRERESREKKPAPELAARGPFSRGERVRLGGQPGTLRPTPPIPVPPAQESPRRSPSESPAKAAKAGETEQRKRRRGHHRRGGGKKGADHGTSDAEADKG
jgi:cell fate regulator YaaT (PSP1 superfamily)